MPEHLQEDLEPYGLQSGSRTLELTYQQSCPQRPPLLVTVEFKGQSRNAGSRDPDSGSQPRSCVPMPTCLEPSSMLVISCNVIFSCCVHRCCFSTQEQKNGHLSTAAGGKSHISTPSFSSRNIAKSNSKVACKSPLSLRSCTRTLKLENLTHLQRDSCKEV